ncbi:phosphoenolpyruvate--protein phosphotransferase [Kiloniella laminariae]|uniref:phosphoenolpyruvate--protein phosphotransferase n=1 Tax=Kiloniella laminariae TaxID=454162 RepID=UPI00035F94C6|nr:phosphoenolpyruvate--protein phosphotransferase [Kiloniella laminariae]
MKENQGERIFEGLAVSPGVVIGPAYVSEASDIQIQEYRVPTAKIPAELIRFADAVERALDQVSKLQGQAQDFHGTAAEELGYLLDAHVQMLKSSSLIGGIKARIQTGQKNAEAAVMAEVGQIARKFTSIKDPYLRTKAHEVREVGHRIVRNLSKIETDSYSGLNENSVILAEEITPADTAMMDPAWIGGFATVLGGPEGHTAIMARSLGLPAVLGVPGLLAGIESGQIIIVDGTNGLVFVNPTEARIKDYKRRQKDIEREVRSLARLRDVPALTKDDHRVALQANVELPRETGQAVANGAEGVGLLRTEFLFMNRDELPTEQEQYEALAEIIDGMSGRPVTVRTLDAGGEKLVSALGTAPSESLNPALGLRAIRLSLKHRDLLETQLRAILRASAHGPLRILLPMVTHPGEVREVRRCLMEVAEELKQRDVRIADPLPPLGIMIEVPGAALLADGLAKVADFFAIGTNDLTMYTLAIDRAEEQVAYLYNPLHPAVLKLISLTVEAARRAHIPVSVCGEVAGDVNFAPLLLGLGVRDLSMSSNALPRVKNRILQLDMAEAVRRAETIMTQHDPGRIAMLLQDYNERFTS